MSKKEYIVLSGKEYKKICLTSMLKGKAYEDVGTWYYFLSLYASKQFDIIYQYNDFYCTKTYQKENNHSLKTIYILKKDFEIINKVQNMISTCFDIKFPNKSKYKLFNQHTKYENYLACFYSFFELSQEQQQLLITEWEIANL